MDRVTVITGATSGIGLVAAETLARQGGHLLLIGRDPERCHSTAERLRRESGNTAVDALCGDLSSMAEVRRLAGAIAARHDRIHLLINNAGAIFMDRRTSADGFEMTFALNHLAYFLLTQLLLEPLRRAAPGRAVYVASEAHRGAQLDFADLQSARRYGGWPAYQRSKLANILLTREVARRHGESGVIAACLHPGFIRTRIGDGNGGLFRLLFGVAKRVGAERMEVGGGRIVHLATTSDPQPGAYYVRDQPATPSAAALDAAAAGRLWEISTELVKPWMRAAI